MSGLLATSSQAHFLVLTASDSEMWPGGQLGLAEEFACGILTYIREVQVGHLRSQEVGECYAALQSSFLQHLGIAQH